VRNAPNKRRVVVGDYSHKSAVITSMELITPTSTPPSSATTSTPPSSATPFGRSFLDYNASFIGYSFQSFPSVVSRTATPYTRPIPSTATLSIALMICALFYSVYQSLILESTIQILVYRTYPCISYHIVDTVRYITSTNSAK